MPARVRTRSPSMEAGGVVYYKGPFGGNYVENSRQSPNVVMTERCEDVVNTKKPYPDGPLLIEKKTSNGVKINGEVALGFKFQDYYTVGASYGLSPSIASETQASTVNRVLSQSGPLTPRVHLPLFIYELKDIPDMIKHAGDLLHGIKTRPSRLSPDKEAAAATLAYQFGWGPLMQDLGRMIDFSETVKRRQLELMKAHTVKGLRRKITLKEDAVTSSGTVPLATHSGLPFDRVPYRQTERIKSWSTIRWTVRDQKQIGRVPTWNEAFKTSYGLNRGHLPIQVWKALPWSWFIDWFYDISNILTANYNSIYYKPSSLNVMTTRTVTRRFSSQSYSYNGGKQRVSISEGEVVLQRKQRIQYPPNASVLLKLPFLDNFKLSILGSMTILRIRGR